MRLVFLSSVSAAMLLSGAAVAGGGGHHINVDVGQAFLNVQDASNAVEAAAGASDIGQDASNIANAVIDERGGPLNSYDDVLQLSFGAQNAINTAVAEAAGVDDIAQSATNVANLVNVNRVDDIGQISFADQIAGNQLVPAGNATDLAQSASNLVNVAEIGTAGRGSLVGQISATSQAASNEMFGGAALGDIAQDATNVANLLNAERINGAIQAVGLDQDAYNAVDFRSGLTDLEQTATNVGNLADAGTIKGPIVQGALGVQQATNAVGGIVGGGANGTVVDLAQSASNLVNVVTTRNGVAGGSRFLPELAQVSNVGQSASNAVTAPAVAGLVQGATNVSNLISVTVDMD